MYDFLRANKAFGNEDDLLNHPDPTLKSLIQTARDYFSVQVKKYAPINKSLIHGDLSVGNVLANGNDISIIDWEFATFKDPMADFSTMFYFDTVQNQGKWRIQIKPEELAALYGGYRAGGGEVDEERLAAWMIADKLGGATYMYWKLHQSGHPIAEDRQEQYRLDFKNLTESLQRELLKL